MKMETYDMRGNGDGSTVGTLTGDHAGRVRDYTPVVCCSAEITGPLVSGHSPKGHGCAGVNSQAVEAGHVIAIQERACAPDLNCGPGGKGYKADGTAYTLEARNKVQAVAICDVIHGDKSCNGKGWNDDGSAYTLDTMATQGVAVAFSCKDNGREATAELSPTLRSMEGAKPNGGGQMAVAFERRFVRTSGGQPTIDLQPCLRADANSGDGAPCVETPMQVRRLTPRECERLQGLPTVEECVTIYTTQSEKSEWSDSPKSNVFAGMKCHNVPDSVRVVEGNVSPPSVECAGNNLLPNQADQNKHVRASVHINLEEHSLVLQIADRCVLCVNIAEGSDTLVHHGLPEHFVQLCVGIVTLSNKTRRGGEGGVPPLTTPFTAQNFGNRNVLKYGHVVEVSAVTAEENISEVQNCLKCIMSNPAQHIQKKEQILQTLCSYVMRVISLCILRKTPRGVLCQLDICTSGGWTLIPWRGKPAADCPDGPRYKGIGNGQTVNVMRWLAERIKKAIAV